MTTEEGIRKGSPKTLSSPKELCNALYAACARQSDNLEFSQKDLEALNIVPSEDPNQLLSCLNKLAQDGLLKIMRKGNAVCWKIVKREDAARYKSLSVEEALVFSYIESAGREGIWTRTIRNRTNLHQAIFNRCLKTLEGKTLIKSFQSAKYPKKKCYILAHLQPSEDVTGGPFYTDGALDEEFVHQLGLWAERYVLSRSWSHLPVNIPERKKRKLKLSVEEAETLKEQEFKEASRERSKAMLPMPAGYKGYPTIPEITKAMNESKLSEIVMKEAEVRQLMEILCWDGRLMKVMDGKGYKAVRKARLNNLGNTENGLTEAPCGRCPVFDLCEDGGPVNARTCTYFQDWLKF